MHIETDGSTGLWRLRRSSIRPAGESPAEGGEEGGEEDGGRG